MRILMIPLTLALLAACATPGPRIRADYDPAVDFATYRTYNFAPELGTDRAGYSTLITGHFKRAVSHEMESRGYTLATDNPDLLVNFFTSVRERTVTQSTPSVSFGTGYFGYRTGLYSTWPLYGRDVSTTQYEVGTASIDVVDARRKQLIWEGVAEGRLTDRVRNDPGPAIDSAVQEVFEKYPARAGSGAARPQ
jgi:hypothetical protein